MRTSSGSTARQAASKSKSEFESPASSSSASDIVPSRPPPSTSITCFTLPHASRTFMTVSRYAPSVTTIELAASETRYSICSAVYVL